MGWDSRVSVCIVHCFKIACNFNIMCTQNAWHQCGPYRPERIIVKTFPPWLCCWPPLVDFTLSSTPVPPHSNTMLGKIATNSTMLP